MDIPAPTTDDNILNTTSDDSADSAMETNDANVVLGDPLANMKLDDSDNLNIGIDGKEIVPNDTLTTKFDPGTIGDFAKEEKPEAEPADLSTLESFMAPSAPEADDKPEEAAATEEIAPLPEPPMDPEKEKFIKTYTEEFDQTLRRATEAAAKILDAIDTTIREHLPEISIPREANEFLEHAPENGKAEKFDDAQEMVRTIMAKANEAKAQSAAAAAEAAKVYDEVQNFKKTTKEQITSLTDGMDLDELRKQAENEKYSHAETPKKHDDAPKIEDVAGDGQPQND